MSGLMNEQWKFFQGFLRQPGQVGSVIPSSKALEQHIVRQIDPEHAETLVELGPGTGGTTRAVLAAMTSSARLLAIDIDPQFVRHLEAIDDPRLIPCTGTAGNLSELLSQHGLAAPDVVFSGIPFSTMGDELGRQVIESVWSSLKPGGRFVAYQFRGAVKQIGEQILGPPSVEWQWFNIPPMRFYRWDKPVQ